MLATVSPSIATASPSSSWGSSSSQNEQQEDTPESNGLVDIVDEAAARASFEQFQIEGTPSEDIEHDGLSYTKFELEPGVYLTLPNFDSSTPGNQGAINIMPAELQFYEGQRIVSISPRVQQAILGAGIGAAGFLIGGWVGAAIGGGVAAYIGNNGICYGNQNLNVYSVKAISWLPYSDQFNARNEYRCGW